MSVVSSEYVANHDIFSCISEQQHISDKICAFAIETEPDFVVVGNNNRIFGSVSQRVVDNAPAMSTSNIIVIKDDKIPMTPHDALASGREPPILSGCNYSKNPMRRSHSFASDYEFLQFFTFFE